MLMLMNVSSLSVLILVVIWWTGGGWYARRVALRMNLEEQPSLASALLQGPLWVRRMLIWSTLDKQPGAQSVPEVSERSRTMAPAATPGPMSAPASIASSTEATAAPVNIPAPAGPAAEATLSPAVPQVFEAALLHAAPQVSEQIPEPIEAAPPAAPQVTEGDIRLPANAAPPKRLPGKPLFGSIKTLCPWCESKEKYGKDAACQKCGRVNPWLVEKWGLETQPAIGVSATAAPAPAPIMPESAPAPVASQPIAAAAAEAPAAVEAAPSVGEAPAAVEEVAEVIEAAPETAAEAAGPAQQQEAELAFELPPAGAQKPKRVPGKPLFGIVKTLCPWCESKEKYGKDAACQKCGRVNPWLVEKWGLESQQLQASSASPAAVSAGDIEIMQAARHRPQQEVELVALDPSKELEAFDDLPAKPRRGNVKTVCPSCRAKTSHDNNGRCKECGNDNDWLRKRWGLIEMSQPEVVVEIAPVAPGPAPVVDPSHCGGCGRDRASDLEGNCIFCGEKLAVIL